MLSYFLHLKCLSNLRCKKISFTFILVKDFNSNRVKDLLIKNTIPLTLHDNLLTLRDSGKISELKEDLFEMITNKNYKIDLFSLADKKLTYDFAKEMNFDGKAMGEKFTRDRTLNKNYLNHQI